MQTTHWGVVIEARDGDSKERQESLSILCESYWLPLYAYVRRRGYGVEEAKDLTQEFFAQFVQKDFLKSVDRSKGRFRNFLLASLNHFLANDWHKRNAKKRGGGLTFVSIDVADAEHRVVDVVSSNRTPEEEYRRRWALALIERAYDRLRAENSSGKRHERFEIVGSYISTDGVRVPYAELEAASGVAAATLKVSVHRLRKRFGELVRDEIRQTVSKDSDVDSELEDLLTSLTL